MGKVFTPETVRDGRLPHPGAHEHAGRYILETIFGECFWDFHARQMSEWNLDLVTRGEGVTRAMIYGSTALGTANIRSDLDTLIIYAPAGAHRTIQKLGSLFAEVEGLFHVPVEHNLHAEGVLYNPYAHHIDPLFASHLVEIQDQTDPIWSVNWPADGLDMHLDELDARTLSVIAERYCYGKARQFARAMADYRGEIDYAAYQRALELPSALGRKVLVALFGTSLVTQDLLQDKKRSSEILRMEYEKRANKYTRRIVNALQKLSKLDTECTQIIIGCSENTVLFEEYEEWLKTNYFYVLKLGYQIAHEWGDYLYIGNGNIEEEGDKDDSKEPHVATGTEFDTEIY